MAEALPIDDILDRLVETLVRDRRAVLQAPPGAGKTTRVPLALHASGAVSGRIVMLEPRRVAARGAAGHLARQLGEAPGQTVGYRMRGETRIGRETRIEVVTEGVLTRMLQSDPSLDGIGCIIFDEFHERSLQADLGLALVLEAAGALRDDLMILVMSATLDAAPVAGLMGDAPILTSEGRAYPVETVWRGRPWADPTKPRRKGAFEAAMVAEIEAAYRSSDAAVLAFLPGVAEIRRVEAQLAGRLPGPAEIMTLYGAMPFKAQAEVLDPAPAGQRRVVLATAIAETSVTIPDVRAVVDGGLSRRPRFDPGSGMMRLATERVTRAEATQRAGRAGRVAPGRCHRLWTKGEEGGLAAFPPVEIEDNDLLGLVLELAKWGTRDPADLAFLTPPPAPAFAAAQALLRDLGALDATGGITAHGRRMLDHPLHPRLAHMVVAGAAEGMGETAARLAAILDARATQTGGTDRLESTLARMSATPRDREIAPLVKTAKTLCPNRDSRAADPGTVLSLAYPDRIARRRDGDAPRYLMSGGKGAMMSDGDPMGREDWLVVADHDGDPREARIRAALTVDTERLLALHRARITESDHVTWDARTGRIHAAREERLGAIVLTARPFQPDAAARQQAVLHGLRAAGISALPWTGKDLRLRARLDFARASGADIPATDDTTLAETLETWLGPHLGRVTKRADLERIDLGAALLQSLDWAARQELDRRAPARFEAPSGTRVPVDYSGATPTISIKLQDMLGTQVHPTIGADRTPLTVTLLSPANRPIQTTADLPGFWTTSYLDVRKDMRGRYPRHNWPEDPGAAKPSKRSLKPRK